MKTGRFGPIMMKICLLKEWRKKWMKRTTNERKEVKENG